MAQPQTTITADGRQLPCYPTMGAMLRFKRHTGKEVQTIDAADTEQLFLFLYCCVQSACAREGVDFQMDEMQFADTLTPQEMQRWAENLTAAPDDQAEKKAPAARRTAKK